MNIWLSQTGESLPLSDKAKKMRTALLADKLIERGHSVVWWASTFDHSTKRCIVRNDHEFTVKDGFKICAIKGLGYKRNISLARFINNRIIARKFKKLASRMPKPDIIVASIPAHDLAYEAVIFAKNNKIPVLVDIRDEWPDLFLSLFPRVCHRFLRVLLYREFQMLQKALSGADGLVAVSGSFLEWGLKYVSRPQSDNDKVFYLGGIKLSAGSMLKKTALLDSLAGKFIVIFVGTFVKNNNPSILVACAKELKGADIHFVLAGDGELWRKVKKEAKGLSNVSFPGWLSKEEADILLQNSHLGVCPALVTRDSFPNKAFSYFSAGLPVISGFAGDLKKIIEGKQCGFYYSPPDNVKMLVSYIRKLYNDKALCQKMSINARKLFDDEFDADKIYEEYARHIEKVGTQV